jgi:hypothetical protein
MSRNKHFFIRVTWIASDPAVFDLEFEPAKLSQADGSALKQACGDNLEKHGDQAVAVLPVNARLGGQRLVQFPNNNHGLAVFHGGNLPPQSIE